MSKAEDLSRQYRDYKEQCGIKDPVMLDEIEEAYFSGYCQAEKDNELSWEDINDVIRIYEDVLDEIDSCENIYIEVLKRFKDFKK